MGYVDDTTVLVMGEEDLRRDGGVIQIFVDAMGMRVNLMNSRLLEVRNWIGGSLGKGLGWTVVDRIRVCGVWYMAEMQECRRENSELVMSRVLGRLRSLRARDVPLQQSIGG